MFFINNVLHCRGMVLQRIFLRNYPAPRKRFYRNVHVSEVDGKFEISLDKRRLKTPLGNKFLLPNEALAVTVATEWDMQSDIIQPHNMHITSLCNTVIDNPCKQTVEQLVDDIIQFLSSDTICFRSKDPQDFVLLQQDKWDPILMWFENRYNVTIDVCEDLNGYPVSEAATALMKKHLSSFSFWCLTGINFTAENLKSLILTLAVLNHIVDVEKAVALSRLETIFQIKQWGLIEWSHSVDEAQIKARVAAGLLFTYLNESTSHSVDKTSSKKVSMVGSARLQI